MNSSHMLNLHQVCEVSLLLVVMVGYSYIYIVYNIPLNSVTGLFIQYNYINVFFNSTLKREWS